VQLFHTKQDLSEAKFGLFFSEFSLSQMIEELATGIELKKQVEVILALEGGLELSKVVDPCDNLCEYFLLTEHPLEIFELPNILLFHLFQSKELATAYMSD